MGLWIKELAAARTAFAEQLAERQSLTVPHEDPDYGYLGQAFPSLGSTEPGRHPPATQTADPGVSPRAGARTATRDRDGSRILTAGRRILELRGEMNTVSGAKITQPGLSGVLRLTHVQDDLAHVLDHCAADEPSGTWTGLACPDRGLAIGSDVDTTVLQQICAAGYIADLIWEAPGDLAAEHNQAFSAAMLAYQAGNVTLADERWKELQAIWSHAWAANLQALELMQQAGITRFAPFKPQRWVIASFEHHCGPHGVQHPHVHNIVAAALTTRPARYRDRAS